MQGSKGKSSHPPRELEVLGHVRDQYQLYDPGPDGLLLLDGEMGQNVLHETQENLTANQLLPDVFLRLLCREPGSNLVQSWLPRKSNYWTYNHSPTSP